MFILTKNTGTWALKLFVFAVSVLAGPVLFFGNAPKVFAATNMSATSTDHWAWNDQIGWIDFYGTLNVNVTDPGMTGYASSSLGDVSLDCATTRIGNICAASNYQVLAVPGIHLSGWAWNDQIGWISFCGTMRSPGRADCPYNPVAAYQVNISASNGDFSGWAWSDTVGWISFNCADIGGCSPLFKVKTDWIPTSTTAYLESSTYDTGITGAGISGTVSWSLVQSSQIYYISAANTIPSNALSFGAGKGNLLVAAVSYRSGSAITSVTDNGAGTANTWNVAFNVSQVADNQNFAMIWTVNQRNDGSLTNVTVNISGNQTRRGIILREYFGTNVSPFDGTNNGGSASHVAGANVIVSGAVTPTVSGDLIVGGSYKGASAGTGFGNFIRDPGNPIMMEDLVRSNTAPVQALFSDTVGSNHVAGVIAFKAAPIFSGSGIGGAQLNSFVWRGSQPPVTYVEFQFAGSNSSSGPWNYLGPSGAGSYYTTPPGITMKVSYRLHNNFRYFRYKAILHSNYSQSTTPIVDDIIINWSP
ncbi:MAG: hypothetical protein Q7S36_01805 [Candidatus Liptonbacteria bacterium]|nr:hypothetical protein [Candidatus Liptonbacteria bacterium]